MTSSGLPLEGTCILDMSRLLPGDYCTLLLAQLGAQVVKVEDTGAGDYQRVFGHQVEGEGALHHLINRGKRSICLDLKDDEDREVFESLVRSSHALVESFRPGVMTRLGYGADALHALRPDLVIASISGYGATGPLAGLAGHDINYLAYSGVLERTGESTRPPVVPPIPYADIIGGALLPALLILAYLGRAEASGRGAVIDASMADGLALMPSLVIADILAGASVPGRGEVDLAGGLACYGCYAVQDGSVAVGALEARFWESLCDVTGLDGYRDHQHDPSAQDAIRAHLATFFASRTRLEVEELFAGRDACVTPVLAYEEMLETEQARHRGYVDRESGQPVPILAVPVMVDGRRLPEVGRAPRQGEHSDEIREEMRRASAGA